MAAADRDPLLQVWLRSVRATHAFLAEPDIRDLLPVVQRAESAGPGLYLQSGFVQAGRPFPILHLREAQS